MQSVIVIICIPVVYDITYYQIRLHRRYIIIFIISITPDFFSPIIKQNTVIPRDNASKIHGEDGKYMHRTQPRRVKNESVRNAIKTRP